MSAPSRHGFTLVELSIVLVIIGLIVGGVLVGRDLIKAAEIRSQISQIEEIKTAVNTFKVKYGYLPGDIPPTQTAQLGFFTFTGTFAGRGCSIGGAGKAYGNNDGIINLDTESNPFWPHLADSKLIKGNYAGTAGNLLTASAGSCISSGGSPIISPTTYTDIEKFIPHSKLSPSIGFLNVYGNYYLAPSKVLKIYTGIQENNILNIYDNIAGANVITANELYNIDLKIDDGVPTSGNVRVNGTADYGGGTPLESPPCTTSGVSPIAYDLSPATINTPNCGADFLF